KRRYLVLRSLLRPRQTDFGALDIAAIKDALSGLEGHVDHRPVSVQPDEPAAVHRPQESGAGGIIKGPPGRTRLLSAGDRHRRKNTCDKDKVHKLLASGGAPELMRRWRGLQRWRACSLYRMRCAPSGEVSATEIAADSRCETEHVEQNPIPPLFRADTAAFEPVRGALHTSHGRVKMKS